MTLENILTSAIFNLGLTVLWLGWGIWVYLNASKHHMANGKKIKWTLWLMINPFALRKFKRVCAEYGFIEE